MASKIFLTVALSAGLLLLALVDAGPAPDVAHLAGDQEHQHASVFEDEHELQGVEMEPDVTALLKDCAMAQLKNLHHSGVTVPQVKSKVMHLKSTISPVRMRLLMAQAAAQALHHGDKIMAEVIAMCMMETMGI